MRGDIARAVKGEKEDSRRESVARVKEEGKKKEEEEDETAEVTKERRS